MFATPISLRARRGTSDIVSVIVKANKKDTVWSNLNFSGLGFHFISMTGKKLTNLKQLFQNDIKYVDGDLNNKHYSKTFRLHSSTLIKWTSLSLKGSQMYYV